MKSLVLTLALPLAFCGREPLPVALLDLAPCDGWTGSTPASERQFARAAAAEKAGRLCANSKLAAVQSVVEDDE